MPEEHILFSGESVILAEYDPAILGAVDHRSPKVPDNFGERFRGLCHHTGPTVFKKL
jgi:hypothetical protein